LALIEVIGREHLVFSVLLDLF
jgi:hypothetical protein